MRWGFLDPSGQWAVPAEFEQVGPFREGRATVRRGAWGYVDPTGRIVIDCKFRLAGMFVNGIANVWRNGARDVLIDRTGKELPYHEHRGPWLCQPDMVAVGRNSGPSERRWGVVALGTLDVVIQPRWAKVAELGPKYWACLHPATQTTAIVDRFDVTVATFPFRWEMAYAVGDYFVFELQTEDAGHRLVVVDADFHVSRTFDGERRMRLLFDERSGCYAQLHASRKRWLDTTLHDIDEPDEIDERDPKRTPGAPFIRSAARKKKLVEFRGRSSPVGLVDAACPATLPDGEVKNVWAMIEDGKRRNWGLLGPDGWVIEPVHDLFESSGRAWRLGTLGREGLVDGLGRWILEPVHTRTQWCGPGSSAHYEGGRAMQHGPLHGGAWRIVTADGSPLTPDAYASVGVWSEDRLPAALSP